MPSLVNEALGALFVHIPKSAGTSITQTFLDHAVSDPDPDAVSVPSNPRTVAHWTEAQTLPGIADSVAHNLAMQGGMRKVPTVHARAVDLRDALGYRRYDALYSFTVVRNPFERMASTYHYIRDNDDNPHAGMCRVLGFEQYIVFNCMLTAQLQYDWFHDLHGRPMVTEVFRLEDLPKLGTALGARFFGAPIVFRYDNRSSNARRDKTTSWNVVPDWVIELFLKTYAPDFDSTGYARDVSPYKSNDTVSEEAERGAWENLPQYLAHPVEMSMRRRLQLDRQRYIAEVVRPAETRGANFSGRASA